MSEPQETGSERETVYVEDTPKCMAARHIGAADGRCQYHYFGIDARCSNDAVAHTFFRFEGEEQKVEMCAEHAREDVPEQPTEEQGKLVTDGGVDEAGTERSPFDAKPLNAEEYRDLLAENPSLVLRVSDGTGDGTYRFWVDDGTLFWRCLNWGSPQQSDQVHLEAVLDDVPGDATTQLLVERATETEAGADE